MITRAWIERTLGAVTAGSPRRLAGVLTLSLGVLVAPGSGAQLTRDVSPAVASERLMLDSYLRVGRTVSGVRLNEPQLRQLYASRIPNPFIPVLRESDHIQLTDEQIDSVAILNRNFVRASDSIWTIAGKYLAALPAEYNIADAWAHVGPAFTAVVSRLLAAVAAEQTLMTRDQYARLSPATASLLDPACIRGLDPSGGTTTRIGGAGALGIGRVRGC